MKSIKTVVAPFNLSRLCLATLIFAPLLFSELSFAAGGNGNSDGGGGDGIKNKVFESYIVDPTQLPAYKKIANLFKKDVSEKDSSAFIKMKTWYIAPVRLNPRSKEVLGVTYINDNPQPIATQTGAAVMIDSSIYYAKGQTIKSQSDILLHEIVEEMYLTKFMSLTEICAKSLACIGPELSNYDLVLSHESPRPLEASDYENIRFMTGWILLGNMKTSSETTIANAFLTHKFDERLFGNSADISKSKSQQSIDVSPEAFFNLLDAAEVTGNTPSSCLASNDELIKDCKVNFNKTTTVVGHINNGQAVTQPGLTLAVTTMNKGEAIVSVPIFQISLSLSDDNEQEATYSGYYMSYSRSAKIGDPSDFLVFLFTKSHLTKTSPLVLKSILYVPLVVTKVNSERQMCQAQKPNPKSYFQHNVLIFRDGDKITNSEKANLALLTSGFNNDGNGCK